VNEQLHIAFANEALELQWFELDSATLKPLPIATSDSDATPATGILVLPSACALPFSIELAFNDVNKIRRVIPQFVADQYADVDETWLFSWVVAAKEPEAANNDKQESGTEDTENVVQQTYKVSGLAFPPRFSPMQIGKDITWRLAVPDAFLIAAAAHTPQAVRLSTPANKFVAFFSGAQQISRIVKNQALPLNPLLAAAQIEEVIELDLLADPSVLRSRLDALLADAGDVDLSGWQQKTRGRAVKYSLAALLIMVLGIIFVGHFFLWFEAHLARSAAQRTSGYVQQAFNDVFPGMPVVDPVSQIRRSISSAQNSLKEAGSVPNINWVPVLQLAARAADHNIKLTQLKARASGVNIRGRAPDYTSLEAFRDQFNNSSWFAKAALSESRQSGSEVLFTLEAQWKD
jgi:hypothetical protein